MAHWSYDSRTELWERVENSPRASRADEWAILALALMIGAILVLACI